MTMRNITVDQLLADRRCMKAYIAARIPKEGCRIVLAEGEDGEAWIDLNPVRDGNGEWDVHLETNCPEWAGIPEAYEYLRREAMTVEEWRREVLSEVARLRVPAHDGGTASRLAITTTPTCCQPQQTSGPSAKKPMLTVREVAVLLDCSYGEARKRMLEGRIRAVKDGRWLRTRSEWVEEYLASHLITPVDPSRAIHELPVPSRRKNHARLKPNGIGSRFLRNRAK
jgi:excisionase family DNA binding protein